MDRRFTENRGDLCGDQQRLSVFRKSRITAVKYQIQLFGNSEDLPAIIKLTGQLLEFLQWFEFKPTNAKKPPARTRRIELAAKGTPFERT